MLSSCSLRNEKLAYPQLASTFSARILAGSAADCYRDNVVQKDAGKILKSGITYSYL